MVIAAPAAVMLLAACGGGAGPRGSGAATTAAASSSPAATAAAKPKPLDTSTARYYLSGPGDTPVPVTGHPSARRSYLREAVFMPDGNLFVSRACCAGVPVRDTSRLMWEVNTSGALVRQVAVGFASLDHTSLDSTVNGKWLLYLAGDILYVSHHGNTPKQLTTGLIAAAWR